MGTLSNLTYGAVLSAIYSYKFTERQLLKLFPGVIERQLIPEFESCAISLHFVKKSGKNEDEEPKISLEDEKRILQKCNGMYDRVLHIKITRKKEFFLRLANTGSMGIGESYMDEIMVVMGDRPLDDLAEFYKRLSKKDMHKVYLNRWNRWLLDLEFVEFNRQSIKLAKVVARQHYDLGNDLYELMLDPYMQYSCGYWRDADNLIQAQEDKLELICKKLQLKPGMTLLDIGCGWGGLCRYVAKRHGVRCIGITISEEQAHYAREKCRGLDVDIRVVDYRDFDEKVDRIVSVGMAEHVGHKNYREFFQSAHRHLVDDGIFLLHMIGLNHDSMPRTEHWLEKYIFPNFNLPYPHLIVGPSQKAGFVMEDWSNFGHMYALTLAAWRENLVRNWPKLKHTYDERFYRMFTYYLATCEGLFRARKVQLWQIVLSKGGLEGGYLAVR